MAPNFMRNDLPLYASTCTNGGAADHTGGTTRRLLVADSPNHAIPTSVPDGQPDMRYRRPLLGSFVPFKLSDF